MELLDKIKKLRVQSQTTPLGTMCDTRLLFEVLNEIEERLDTLPHMKSDEWKKAIDTIKYIGSNYDNPKTNKSIYEQCSLVHDYISKTLGFDIKCSQYEEVIGIIEAKGFDKSIKDYVHYDDWLESKIEQFDMANKGNPAILSWEMFDSFTYSKQEFYTLKNNVFRD